MNIDLCLRELVSVGGEEQVCLFTASAPLVSIQKDLKALSGFLFVSSNDLFTLEATFYVCHRLFLQLAGKDHTTSHVICVIMSCFVV